MRPPLSTSSNGCLRTTCSPAHGSQRREARAVVVDLAFEEDGRWTVVAYKTDREIAEQGETQYRRQLSLYTAAVARATGKPAAGILVRI